MDISKRKSGFVGVDGGRAVSPVIGVVLMVAIVVLLAAVVAGVMTGMVGDMGQTEAQGAAEFSVDESANEITVTVTALSDAEELEIKGDVTGDNGATVDGLTVGQTATFTYDSSNTGSDDFTSASGTVTAVAVKTTEDGETIRTTVGSQDFDFS